MIETDIDNFCHKLIDSHKSYDLEEIEIKISKNQSKAIKTRNIKLENIEKSDSFSLVINVYKGKKQASLRFNNLII